MTIYFDGAARKVRDFPVSESERAARVQLAACYRIFHHLGWVEMIFNHITLRVPGPEKLFLINPFGLLGWDGYGGECEIITDYFASSGTGQINAEFHL